MNEKECLYRVLGIIEGSEELGGGFLPSRLVSKIKEMISVVVKEYQPVIYREPETVRSTVTTNTGQQVVVQPTVSVDLNETKYWTRGK